MPFFKKILRPTTVPFDAPVHPEEPVFVIGDLHGCAKQMVELLYKLEAKDKKAKLVFVGDFIDRGENSKLVLDALWQLRPFPRVVCLRGNHEDMLLKFLKSPNQRTSRWLRYGGLNTLGSYRIKAVPDTSCLLYTSPSPRDS